MRPAPQPWPCSRLPGEVTDRDAHPTPHTRGKNPCASPQGRGHRGQRRAGMPARHAVRGRRRRRPAARRRAQPVQQRVAGATTRETEIIANTAPTAPASPTSPTTAAARSTAAARAPAAADGQRAVHPREQPGRRPRVRVRDRRRTEVGAITSGKPGDQRRSPPTPRGVATGLNADQVDGKSADDIAKDAARARPGADALRRGGRRRRAPRSRAACRANGVSRARRAPTRSCSPTTCPPAR